MNGKQAKRIRRMARMMDPQSGPRRYYKDLRTGVIALVPSCYRAVVKVHKQAYKELHRGS